MRLVFMGTPDFASASLEALLRSDDSVVGVVTQPDRPKGRGQILTPSPVKLLAQRAQIPLLQPLKMKDPEFLHTLAGWNPELIAVAAFGRILPPAILSLPPRGCINVHGSLLPKYRGAGPIQWAIVNGETETGITTMLMDEGMDTGAMLLQEALTITPDDTAGTLSPRLAALGGRLLVETIETQSRHPCATAARFFTGDLGAVAEKGRWCDRLGLAGHCFGQPGPRTLSLAWGPHRHGGRRPMDDLESSGAPRTRDEASGGDRRHHKRGDSCRDRGRNSCRDGVAAG